MKLTIFCKIRKTLSDVFSPAVLISYRNRVTPIKLKALGDCLKWTCAVAGKCLKWGEIEKNLWVTTQLCRQSQSIQDTGKDRVAWQSAALRAALLLCKDMVLFNNHLSLTYFPLNSTCSLYLDRLGPLVKAVVRSVHSLQVLLRRR